MAQTAMAIQTNEVVGVTLLTEKQAIEIARKMLKNFRKLEKEITSRERKAKATGRRFMNKYHQELAEVGKEFAKSIENPGIIYKEKFERFFGEQAKIAADQGMEMEAKALSELEEYMIGTTAWGYDQKWEMNDYGATDWKGKIVTTFRAEQLWQEEMKDLIEEMEFIRDTIFEVGKFDSRGEYLLYMQYIKGMKVEEVIADMAKRGECDPNLAESTYHVWRKEALKTFAKLAGLC